MMGRPGGVVVTVCGCQRVRLSACAVVSVRGCHRVWLSACAVVSVYGCQRVRWSPCAVVSWLAYLVTLVVSITDAPRAVLCRQGGRGFDKFHILDEAVEAFRAFATQRNVHVTLVVHPRKEADGVALNTGPIGGVFPCLLWRWLLLGTCGPLAG